MSVELVFVLGDKLPWISKVVLAIYDYAPGGLPKITNWSSLRKNAVNSYVKALIELWQKAFGAEHIASRKTVANKIRAALNIYFNRVSCNRSSYLSKRERIKQ